MKIFAKICLVVPSVLLSVLTRAQAGDATLKTPKFFSYDSLHQTDIIDVAHSIFGKKMSDRTDTGSEKSSKTHVSILPAVGYSLQTGFAAIVSANIAFYNGGNKGQNISTITASFTYSQYKQYILPLLTNIWSKNGKYNFQRMQLAAGRMQQLIDDLLAFSRIATTELKFDKTDLKLIIEEVKAELKDTIQEKHATIEATELGTANIIAFQFRQLMYNLISNALKFSQPDVPSHIIIKSEIIKGNKSISEKLSMGKNYCHITVKDNGIGFESHFSERIFEVFQKLHGKEVYGGTGIGLAIVKKIVENHNGIIIATSELKKGATFDIYFPAD